MRPYSKLWTLGAVAGLATLVLAALVLPKSFRLTAFSDVIQCLLLLSGTLSLLPHALRSRGRMRLFWALITLGMAFWFFYQLLWTYIEVWLRRDVPDLFVGDIVLFLHIVPLMAALALRPHAPQDEYAARLGMLDFALLLVWWFYLYVLIVLPWQYAVADEIAYSKNLNSVYLAEKVAFLIALAIAWAGSRGGWRFFYANLFGASVVYAASSYLANWAISRNNYYSGSLYDIPLAVSMAWITLIGLWTGDHQPQANPRKATAPGVWLARLGIIAAFSLPLFGGWALCDTAAPAPIRSFRLVLTLAAALVMGIMVFARQRLLDRELLHLLKHSHDSFANLKRLQAQITESEKLASIGQLVGGAAHELNNPITAMLGYSDLLLSTSLSAEQSALATNIRQQVRRTKSLVASLLSFAKPGLAIKGPVDLNTLVRTAVKISQPQWQTLQIEVRLELAPDLPPANADSNQLLQVCLQVLGDALHTANRGNHGALALTTQCAGTNLILKISEVGSEPSASRTLQRTDPDLEPLEPHGGVGLTACQAILHEHQGRILCEKQENGSNTISVELAISSPLPEKLPVPLTPQLRQSQPFA